jgi:hypothetical protein
VQTAGVPLSSFAEVKFAGSTMVDRDSRRACAQLLRRLMRGEMGGEEFEFAVDQLGSADSGIRAIKSQAWACYSDYSPVERSVARAVRTEIARSILFLQGDAEYRWPPYPSGDFPIYNWLFNILTLGWWERRKANRLEEWQRHGDSAVWPFHSRAEYDAACARPQFLVGSS